MCIISLWGVSRDFGFYFPPFISVRTFIRHISSDYLLLALTRSRIYLKVCVASLPSITPVLLSLPSLRLPSYFTALNLPACYFLSQLVITSVFKKTLSPSTPLLYIKVCSLSVFAPLSLFPRKSATMIIYKAQLLLKGSTLYPIQSLY